MSKIIDVTFKNRVEFNLFLDELYKNKKTCTDIGHSDLIVLFDETEYDEDVKTILNEMLPFTIDMTDSWLTGYPNNNEKVIGLMLSDLTGRKGFDFIWGNLDGTIQQEIINPYLHSDKDDLVELFLNELTSRGFDNWWDGIDEDIQEEIFDTLTTIVKNTQN